MNLAKTTSLLSQRLKQRLGVETLCLEQAREGHSQQVFQCLTSNGTYCVKLFNCNVAYEKELLVYQQGYRSGLLPKLIDAHEKTLILEYLTLPTIAKHYPKKHRQLIPLIKALRHFHRSVEIPDEKIPHLNLLNVLNDLKQKTHLTDAQNKIFIYVYEAISKTLMKTFTSGLCHGDFNNLNVFVDEHHYKIIDFEAVSYAPLVYDLMMLLSINQFSANDIEFAIATYQQAQGLTADDLHITHLNAFYHTASLINAMWYQQQAQIDSTKAQYFKGLSIEFFDKIKL